MQDTFSDYYEDYLTISYDSVDRIVLNAHYIRGCIPGGFRLMWRDLYGSDENLDNTHLMRLAQRTGRRIRAFAKSNKMNSKIFSIVVMSLLVLPQLECVKNLTESTDLERIYVVQTIQDVSVEEFADNSPTYDWPLVIKLESYEPNGIYKGSVRLAKLGWQKIDRNCTEKNCFIVDTDGKLGPVEFVVFSNLNINDENMTGWFGCAGSIVDDFAYIFTAVKR